MKTMTIRQLCDTAELLRIQNGNKFTMRDIAADGPILRITFSDAFEGRRRNRICEKFKDSVVEYDCGSADFAMAWHDALKEGQKLSTAYFMKSGQSVPNKGTNRIPGQINQDAAAPKVLGAKIITDSATGRKDTIKIRFSSLKDGTIPYELVKMPCEDTARQVLRNLLKQARADQRSSAALCP